MLPAQLQAGQWNQGCQMATYQKFKLWRQAVFIPLQATA